MCWGSASQCLWVEGVNKLTVGPDNPVTPGQCCMYYLHTNRVEQSFHGVLWTHGPAGQGDGSSAEVVAVVKERLVHPRQGHLFLGTQ